MKNQPLVVTHRLKDTTVKSGNAPNPFPDHRVIRATIFAEGIEPQAEDREFEVYSVTLDDNDPAKYHVLTIGEGGVPYATEGWLYFAGRNPTGSGGHGSGSGTGRSEFIIVLYQTHDLFIHTPANTQNLRVVDPAQINDVFVPPNHFLIVDGTSQNQPQSIQPQSTEEQLMNDILAAVANMP